MYQTCSFRATISQKSTYLIQHYAISGFGWTYLYNHTFKFFEFEPILLHILPIFNGFVMLENHKLSNSLLEMTLFKKKISQSCVWDLNSQV